MDSFRGIKIHFIGIGGSSMSGLAELAISYGAIVSGSDRTKSPLTDKLESMGATIFIGQAASNIANATPDIIVYTVAISEDNPELMAARASGAKVLERMDFLNFISENFKYSVAVSGTHGKTTSTGMISSILLAANVDPTIHIGSILPQINSSVRPGNSDYFVTEACEYHAHMLRLHPFAELITNVEEEHLDYYTGGLPQIILAFTQFCTQCDPSGFVVVSQDSANAMQAVLASGRRFYTYGLRSYHMDADYEADNIDFTDGATSYDLYIHGQYVSKINLNTLGLHNVKNSLGAIAIADNLGIDFESIKLGLSQFEGTARRFQRVGTYNGATLIDDYGHHPTEIRATLEAARLAFPKGKIYAVFQAHTYSRAKAFLKDFVSSLSLADETVVARIYAAREKDPGDMSGEIIANNLINYGANARFIESFEGISDYLAGVIQPGDAVISLTAGDSDVFLKYLLNKEQQ